MLCWLSHGEGRDAVTWSGWDKLSKGHNYWTWRLSCQVYGLRGVSWWLCVCFTWLDMTTPPWCREKVMVYYYYMLYKLLSWKITFPVTSKPSAPTIFNLQASDWVHCEEETGVHTGISRQTSKFVLFFKQFFKLFILAKKWISTYWPKFIINYNWTKRYSSIRIYLLNAMTNSNFWYLKSSDWGVLFSLSAPKCLFIFYSSFSLRLTENLQEQKKFLQKWSTCFVYIIFL